METTSILTLAIRTALFVFVTAVAIVCLWISSRSFTADRLPKDTREEIPKAIQSGAAVGVSFVAIVLDIAIWLWEKPDGIKSVVSLSFAVLCITIPIIVFSSISAFIRFQHIKALKKGVSYLIERNTHKDE